ncbi:MAG TPA: hypothetical protein VJ327_03295 [Patescibacteria group bacterium]|nr:hypothetical protein [Patescibacteria group bacterium]
MLETEMTKEEWNEKTLQLIHTIQGITEKLLKMDPKDESLKEAVEKLEKAVPILEELSRSGNLIDLVGDSLNLEEIDAGKPGSLFNRQDPKATVQRLGPLLEKLGFPKEFGEKVLSRFNRRTADSVSKLLPELFKHVILLRVRPGVLKQFRYIVQASVGAAIQNLPSSFAAAGMPSSSASSQKDS